MGNWDWSKPFNEMRKRNSAEQRARRAEERPQLLEFRRRYKEMYGRKRKSK